MEKRCKSLSSTYVLPFKTLQNVLCAALQYVTHATTDVSMYDNDTKVMETKCQFCTEGFKPASIPGLVSNARECRGRHVNDQLSKPVK